MPRKQRFKPSRKPKPQISEAQQTVSSIDTVPPDTDHKAVEAQTARTPREDVLTSAIEDAEGGST